MVYIYRIINNSLAIIMPSDTKEEELEMVNPLNPFDDDEKPKKKKKKKKSELERNNSLNPFEDGDDTPKKNKKKKKKKTKKKSKRSSGDTSLHTVTLPPPMETLESALKDTSRLIIKQEVSLIEAAAQAAANAIDVSALGAFGEMANKYDIFTSNGGKKFRVVETSQYCGCNCTNRVCCRPNHALKLHVSLPENNSSDTDTDKQGVIMHMDRPCKCGQCCACTNCCRQEMSVYEGMLKGGNTDPSEEDPATLIGYIQQPIGGGMLSPKLNVMNREGGETLATIQAEAKCCIAGICCDHTFIIRDPAGQSIGKIVKEKPEGLAEIAKELATDADNFTMHVPPTMNPKEKGVMLAALHLIDYMFFENEGDFACDVVNMKCQFKCCDLYCCGSICPCSCKCDCCGGDGDDEEGED